MRWWPDGTTCAGGRHNPRTATAMALLRLHGDAPAAGTRWAWL